MALVREFHEKFGLPIGSGWFDGGERRLREALLSEEHGEYLEAEDRDEFEAIADALGDMVSVIYGTALSYGIDLDAVLAEIHRSNMTKERDPAMQYPAKNIVKGEGYEPPNLRPILERRSPEPEADRCPNCGMLDSERPALPAEGDTGASSAESTSRPEKGTQADLGSPPASTGSEGFESQGRVSAQGEDVERWSAERCGNCGYVETVASSCCPRCGSENDRPERIEVMRVSDHQAALGAERERTEKAVQAAAKGWERAEAERRRAEEAEANYKQALGWGNAAHARLTRFKALVEWALGHGGGAYEAWSRLRAIQAELAGGAAVEVEG